jgi:uncharacterized membrane protein
MRTIKVQARIAGALYALVALSGPIGLVYVPNKLIHSGDAAATANAIRVSADLLRAGIASELFHQAVEVWLVLALFRLFQPVDRHLARSMAILGFLPIPIVFLNTLNEVAALLLQSGVGYFSAFTSQQLDALTMLFMRIHGMGFQVAGIFWGLWLFPFGGAIVRSAFIPRILGYLVWLAGIGYVVEATILLVLPQFRDSVVVDIAGILDVGELPIIFWLLLVGARGERAREALPA